MSYEPAPVEIWLADLEKATWSTVLSSDERERAAKFRFERDRVRWSAARSALRAILACHENRDPLALRFVYGKYGKPSLEDSDVEFNLSHSGTWAMIAVTAATPVGIDLEQIRENVDMARLLRRIGEAPAAESPAELFRMWARREAKTKAVGGPLMEIPTGDLRVLDLRAPDGYSAALAMEGRDAVVNYRNFHPQ